MSNASTPSAHASSELCTYQSRAFTGVIIGSGAGMRGRPAAAICAALQLLSTAAASSPLTGTPVFQPESEKQTTSPPAKNGSSRIDEGGSRSLNMEEMEMGDDPTAVDNADRERESEGLWVSKALPGLALEPKAVPVKFWGLTSAVRVCLRGGKRGVMAVRIKCES